MQIFFRVKILVPDPIKTYGKIGPGDQWQIAGFQKEMRDANVDWQFLEFGGAVHCFAIPTADGSVPGCLYNERAAKRGVRQMHLFFDEAFATH